MDISGIRNILIMKILITENQYKKIVTEEIDAAQATTFEGSIKTILDGSRGVAFDNICPNEDLKWDLIKRLQSLGLISIMPAAEREGNQNYIFYNPNYEKEALELYSISSKYGGYLAYYATPEESRRIGELLSYKKQDIDDYINRTGTFKR